MIYLAPIQGITDRTFRSIYSRFFNGVDTAMAPFISTSKRKNVETVILRELVPEVNTGLPVIPQILSRDPEDFIPLANVLHEMGYRTVNWNLGCPFPVVVKKGKGSGMLCYPDRIEQFLEKTIPAIKTSLSIKLRLGLAYPDEILTLIPIFNRYPIDEIIIHPRTGRQMYEGEVDLETFSECLKLSKHPVVYNGDINSYEKFQALAAMFPSVNRWMIGRGILRDPFLAEKIVYGTDRPGHEKIEIIRSFHDRLFDEYSRIMSGPSHLTDRMKGIWFYLADFFEDGAKLRKEINKTKNVNHYLDVVKRITLS